MTTIICLGVAMVTVAADDDVTSTSAPAQVKVEPEARGKPAGNMELWLGESVEATSEPVSQAITQGASPFGPGGPDRGDAVPGVVELSDGQRLAGELMTTVEKPWLVWVEAEKRWRRVPLISLLGLEAVVVEEKMELAWRWKAMGEPERVYTGKKYPTRQYEWKFHLIDDSYITGSVKGQPLWVRRPDGTRDGPFVLHERSRGNDGQAMKDLIYVKRVIVSREMMNLVLADQQRQGAKPK